MERAVGEAAVFTLSEEIMQEAKDYAYEKDIERHLQYLLVRVLTERPVDIPGFLVAEIAARPYPEKALVHASTEGQGV